MSDPIGRVASWLKAYLLLALLLTSLWTQLDALRWGVVPLLALLMALELRPGWFVPGGPAAAAPIEPLGGRLFPVGPTWLNLAIGVLIWLPVLVHVILTRHEEFPFGGDEGYEFSATRSYALLLRQTLPYVAVWTAVAFGILGRFLPRVRWTVFLLGLLVLSYRFPPHVVVARYPAAFYFLAMPLNVIGEVVGWQRPFFANHVVNALSIPAWLFVLRPILLRKWPDWTILPFGILFFYQKETLQFFGGGAAIEPWAMVWLCLAVEALIVLPDEAGWLAVLLIGCSFMTKEPGVFVFPIVWLVAASGSKRLSDLVRYVACGLTMIAPFVVYYVVRRQASIHRTVGFGGEQQVFTWARVTEWGERVAAQLGPTGLVVVVLLALYGVAGWPLLQGRPRHRRVHVGLVVTAFSLLLFNFADELGVPFTAYTRYMMYPLVLMGLLLVPVAIGLLERGRRWSVVLLAIAILFLQAPPLVRTLALDFQPDFARNSLEWPQCPVFFPVRELLGRMQAGPDAAAVRSVRLLGLTVDPVVAPIAYPDLNRRWPIRPETLTSHIDCGCRSYSEAVLVGVELRSGVALEFPPNQAAIEATRLCVAQVRMTCSVIEAHHENGELVGILGIPRTDGRQ
jgi:hypothetical protein